jgi:DNA-binding NarL/FixJ family response regulator
LRILLVEDHAVVREGLRLVLERDLGVEGLDEAATLDGALDVKADPDVIVADLMLPDARGPEVVSQLRNRFHNARILVLTMLDAPTDVQLALSSGANGYLLKEAAATDLVDAVQRVARGEEYLHPSLGAAALRARHADTRPTHRTHPPLSPREHEILQLLAIGHTNSEVAELLAISLRTVETHRAHIVQKLGAQSRAELIRIAREEGLLDS